MKVLVVGASGMIGSEALNQCLIHQKITSVVAFGRRELPAPFLENPKLRCVVIKNFAEWPQHILEEHSDAAAMIWAMGSYNGSVTADLEYPMTFLESMTKVLEGKPSRPPFRCVHLSGKFVRQNQEESLWFLEKPRKLKGVLETKALAFGETHSAVWKTFIVKPAAVTSKSFFSDGLTGMVTGISAVFGENWSIRIDELGAFMAYLATDGKGEESLIENARIVRRGRELLESQKNAPQP